MRAFLRRATQLSARVPPRAGGKYSFSFFDKSAQYGVMFLSTKTDVEIHVSSKNAPGVKGEKLRRGEDHVGVVGEQYSAIIYKGRGGRAIGLADLRKLLQACHTTDQVKYAVKAVEYYQGKGVDFAEDVAALLINACVTGKKPKAAARVITKVNFIHCTKIHANYNSCSSIDGK